MEVINELNDFLQSHANRDKVLNLACYGLKLWGLAGGCGGGVGGAALLAASARLAQARAVARLLDDAAIVKTFLPTVLDPQEGGAARALAAGGGAAALAYLQLEKAAFVLDSGLVRPLPPAARALALAHKAAWALLAFFAFLRAVRAWRAAGGGRARAAAALAAGKAALDTAHAVSWLPRGALWGGALPPPAAAALATAAAALGLLAHYHDRKRV